MIDDFHLLAYAVFVDGLEDSFDELGAHAAEGGLCSALVEDLVVAGGLQHGHPVLLLEGAYLAAHTHALGEYLDELVVALVDLCAELCEVLRGVLLVADDEEAEDVAEHVGGHLLGGIAPCSVGVAVALDDEAVEAQVHGLLAEWCHEIALAADVAGVAEDGKPGDAAAQLDGDVPLRQVAVDLLVVGGEAAVDGAQTPHSCAVDALHGSYP